MPNNIISKEEYLKGMMSGIHQVSELIKPTYGGCGTNVIVESNLPPYHQVINDCEIIIQAVKVEGHAEKIAVDFLKEISGKQDKLLGNGRKTTILMVDKLLEEGYKYEGDKNKLKRELDALIPIIENEIDKQTKKITVADIEAVATTASENPETGKLLCEIYEKIGANGIIQPEGSGTFETSYRFIDGVRFDMTGYLSPFMVHDEQAVKDKVKETKAVYEKPLILVTKKKITTDEDINPILTEMINTGQKDLVIFTGDMDSGVASMLIDLHKSKRLNILIIKAPILWTNYVFEDFAKCTGATIIEDATGKNFKNMHLTDLGTCDKIIVDQDETILIGTKDITEHCQSLMNKGDEDSKLRLSWLTNKTVILKLGANSETDLSLKRLKTYDGIRSSELALKHGIVQGGGVCLWKIANDKTNELWKSSAGRMLTLVLEHPYNINQENGATVIPDNIVDASMVIKKAVRHAIGIASTILTAPSLVYIPEPTAVELALMNKQQNAFQ